MAKHKMQLGQRILDADYGHEGVIVMQKIGDKDVILVGYENNPKIHDRKDIVSKPNERLYITSDGDVYYTWTDDLDVTEIGSQLIAPNLAIHEGFPEKKSFVAVWFSSKSGEMFSASLHYNAEEEQYYSYDDVNDQFWPECDHGYSKVFFNKVGAVFFVKGEQDA